MQVIFRGDPIELERGGGLSRTSIDAYGVHFVMGEPVDVSSLTDVQKRKLANNPHFEVVAEGGVAVVDEATEPAAVEADADAEEDVATAAHVERASKRKK